MTKLTEKDWLKLRDYDKSIALRVQARLPGDWYLTLEEIESAVYDTFIKLLRNYEPGAQSATSYCWQFGEKYTYRDLMREYGRLKKQVVYDESEPDDEDEYAERHQYGEMELETQKSLDEHLEERDDMRLIAELAERNGLSDTAEALKTCSERETADRFGISKSAVHKRVEKLRRLCEDVS